jgi:hypothetical protein
MGWIVTSSRDANHGLGETSPSQNDCETAKQNLVQA